MRPAFGTIEKSAYLKKKDELIKLKTETIQKKSSFGQKGKLWLEPLRDWLETTSNANELNSTPDFTEIKSFLEKIGTNRILKDKKVSLDFVAPYSFIPIYKGLAGKPKNELVVNKKGDAAKNATSPIWWYLQESNQGHKDFQSFALPTELRYQLFWERKHSNFIFLYQTFFCWYLFNKII